jgi:hypothetical protein
MLYVPTHLDSLLGLLVKQVKKPINFPVNSIVDFHVNGISVSFMRTFPAIFLKHTYTIPMGDFTESIFREVKISMLSISALLVFGNFVSFHLVYFLGCHSTLGSSMFLVDQSFPRIIEQTSRHAVCLDLSYSHAHHISTISPSCPDPNNIILVAHDLLISYNCLC